MTPVFPLKIALWTVLESLEKGAEGSNERLRDRR